MIVADSTIWIDYFRGVLTRQTRILFEAIARRESLALDIVMTEVLQGFSRESHFARALAAFDDMPIASAGGRDIAVAAARNYRTLREKGVTPRKTIDVLIGTFCIENRHYLLHADRDFDAMETHLGLKTI